MNYLVDFKPVILDDINYELLASIENKISNKVSISIEEAKYFLDTLCYIARNKLNEKMDDFSYKCDIFQVMFAHYFYNFNCEFIPCMTQNVITNDIVGHSFSILKLLIDNEEKLFLIDPSYIQFFNKEKCRDENYFLKPNDNNYVLLTPDPGYFIKENDMELIISLLNHGYIVLTENFARIYGDSFLNTKRGLIFDKQFHTIPGKIYINSFLKGKELIRQNEETLRDLGLLLPLFKDIKDEKKK